MRLPRLGLGLTLALTLATAISLPASAQDATLAGTPGAGTPATDSATLAITSQETLGSEIGQALSLSPDGRWVALARLAPVEERDTADEICAYPIVTREAPTCVDYTGAPIAADSVAWSPDSTRFVFTEDLPRRLVDPDIWVFDRDDATITDLTDDGVEGDVIDATGAPLIDVAPAWSPDGEQIAFARSVNTPFGGTGAQDTTIQRISADGGEPTEVTTVSDQWLAVYAGIRWLPDDTILYSVDQPDPDTTDGLWAVSADGGDPEQLFRTDEVGLDAAILADVSVGGLGLLLTGTDDGDPRVGRYAIVDLTTGDIEPVTIATDQPVAPVVSAAGFSPDGGALLMAVFFPGEDQELIVRDLETGADTTVGVLDGPVGAADYRAGIVWGENGFVLIPAAQNTSLLLTVEDAE